MIECEAAESEAVVKVAWPALRVPVPRVVAPSLNVTVPVGVPLPGGAAVTVAVKVTAWPNTDGLPEAATAVLVSALVMGVLKTT